MKNMCVSAGISILFNQIRYEHPHHKSPKPLIQMVSDFYFFLTEMPSKTKSSGNRGFKTNLLLPELFCFPGKTWFFPVFLMNPLRWYNLIVLGKIWRFRGIIWFHFSLPSLSPSSLPPPQATRESAMTKARISARMDFIFFILQDSFFIILPLRLRKAIPL